MGIKCQMENYISLYNLRLIHVGCINYTNSFLYFLCIMIHIYGQTSKMLSTHTSQFYMYYQPVHSVGGDEQSYILAPDNPAPYQINPSLHSQLSVLLTPPPTHTE